MKIWNKLIYIALLYIFMLPLSQGNSFDDGSYTDSEIDSLKYSVTEVAGVYHASMTYIFKQQPLINSLSKNKDKLFGQRFINEVKTTYNTMFNQPFPSEENTYKSVN